MLRAVIFSIILLGTVALEVVDRVQERRERIKADAAIKQKMAEKKDAKMIAAFSIAAEMALLLDQTLSQEKLATASAK
jgi:hypothetical protein